MFGLPDGDRGNRHGFNNVPGLARAGIIPGQAERFLVEPQRPPVIPDIPG